MGRCHIFTYGSTNVTVEYGYFGKFTGTSAAHSEIASFTGSNFTVRHNVFTHVDSTGGLMFDNSSNPSGGMYVYGNVFYQPSGDSWVGNNGIIGGWTGGNGEQFHNVLVYNNTFVNVTVPSAGDLAPNI